MHSLQRAGLPGQDLVVRGGTLVRPGGDAAVVRDALEGGMTVICDATFLERARRARFRALAGQRGGDDQLPGAVAPRPRALIAPVRKGIVAL